MCGCAKRREIGHRVVASMRNGNLREAQAGMREMRQSMGQDLSGLAKHARPLADSLRNVSQRAAMRAPAR